MSDRPELAGMLILGLGNILMGDEGVGVHVVRQLQELDLPEEVVCLDGGTGSFQLLGPMEQAERVVMIDAVADGAAPGTLRQLRPRFSTDYPRTLTAHDIGLKDLLDAFYLMGDAPDVTLFTVTISMPQPMSTEMSGAVAARVPEIVRAVRAELFAGPERGAASRRPG